MEAEEGVGAVEVEVEGAVVLVVEEVDEEDEGALEAAAVGARPMLAVIDGIIVEG